MAEEDSSAMNLDLNLGPALGPNAEPMPGVDANLDHWIEAPYHRLRDVARLRAHQRRWRRFRVSPERQNIPMDLSEFMVGEQEGVVLQASEGSMVQEGGVDELEKACENVVVNLEDGGGLDAKGDSVKGTENDGSFFDCNICFDLAKEPVVSCCGHLFCWPCLYRWLHVNTDIKECPVCKGEVTVKNVTPIYGRGNGKPKLEEDASGDIPLRPQARRIESFRQTLHRTALNFPMEEMIRRLRSRFDLTRDLVQSSESADIREVAERNASRINRLSNDFRENAARTSSLIDRLLSTRLRREEISVAPDEAVDLMQSRNVNPEVREVRRLHSLLLRRSHAHRNSTGSSLSSTLGSTERILEYLHTHSSGRNQEHHPPGDDRDSVSSVAAVINSESQVDTAVEIDSMVSLSTSTSRQRADGSSRASDMDSGDSRPPRRRRLN
ncbi:hypothetical protein MLD38_035615 [Melastoma candidum]|uniref:Uncharacterized protein n=1 Tax=Melastoma candidum TaxID=119954 RepID=A0ACB9LGL4_9MYRT|nr:hypothetical protein MLD38_035615 [Melastoma candidum]